MYLNLMRQGPPSFLVDSTENGSSFYFGQFYQSMIATVRAKGLKFFAIVIYKIVLQSCLQNISIHSNLIILNRLLIKELEYQVSQSICFDTSGLILTFQKSLVFIY